MGVGRAIDDRRLDADRGRPAIQDHVDVLAESARTCSAVVGLTWPSGWPTARSRCRTLIAPAPSGWASTRSPTVATTGDRRQRAAAQPSRRVSVPASRLRRQSGRFRRVTRPSGSARSASRVDDQQVVLGRPFLEHRHCRPLSGVRAQPWSVSVGKATGHHDGAPSPRRLLSSVAPAVPRNSRVASDERERLRWRNDPPSATSRAGRSAGHRRVVPSRPGEVLVADATGVSQLTPARSAGSIGAERRRFITAANATSRCLAESSILTEQLARHRIQSPVPSGAATIRSRPRPGGTRSRRCPPARGAEGASGRRRAEAPAR